MHTIYTTRAFVLRKSERGEADAALALFTEDVGLVWAHARGIRKNEAKLRYHAQDLSLSRVSLVRGRSSWRLTNAAECASVLSRGAQKETRPLRARVAQLLLRFVGSGEKSAELFWIISELFNTLGAVPLTTRNVNALEVLTVLRILRILGYVGDDAAVSPFLNSSSFGRDVLSAAALSRREIVLIINRALEASNL